MELEGKTILRSSAMGSRYSNDGTMRKSRIGQKFMRCGTHHCKCRKELDNLTRMRYKELIDDETFIKERDV